MTLTQTTNDFKGAVSITTSGAVSLRDKDDLTVSLVGATEVSAVTGAKLGLSATGALKLAALQVGGDLTLASAGAITQDGALAVSGVANISAGSGAVTLAQAENDFKRAVSITTTGAVSLRDKDDLTVSLSGASEVSAVTGARLGLSATGALKLASVQVGGDLTLGSTGAITQTGAVKVEGTSQITATGQNITLTHVNNEFGGVVTVSGAQTTLTDKSALSVVLDATGDVTLTAKGTLEAGGKVAGEGSDLTLTTSDGGATALAATTVGGS